MSAKLCLLSVVVSAAAVGCSTADRSPVATSSSAAAQPSSSVTAAPPIVKTDTIEIGDSGVRCLVGNVSLACVAGVRPMLLGKVKAWSMVGAVAPPGNLEPGFTPAGVLSGVPHVGDVALVDAASCRPGGVDPGKPEVQPMQCRKMSLTATISEGQNDILAGVVAAVGAGTMTLRFTESEFTVPIPNPAPLVFYQLSPGQRLTQDQPAKIRPWTLTLHGGTLAVGGPYGTTEIAVGP